MNRVNRRHRMTGRHSAHFRHTVRRAVAVALVIVAVVSVGAAPAQAAATSIVNMHTNRCLADSFAGGLQVLPCRFPDPTQNWSDLAPAVAFYQFHNAHTGRCLADSFAGGLEVLECDFPDTQLWIDRADGQLDRFDNYHTGRCLADSFAGGLEVLDCDVTVETQLWRR
jgi:hypothetical protein